MKTHRLTIGRARRIIGQRGALGVGLVSLAFLAGCSAAEPGEFEPDATGTEAEEIIDGDASTNNKVVQVIRNKPDGTSRACTGTLLRSDIVLTASHCVGTQAGGQWLRHRIVTRSGTTIEVTNKEQVRSPPEGDIALVKLDSHVKINGHINYWTSVHEGTVSGLVGKSVECVGYGENTCNASDNGTQQKATLKVKSASSTTLSYVPNGSGQILSAGDSGGPCFLNGKVVGTTRTVKDDCSGANQVPVTTYASWIRETMGEMLNDYYTSFTSGAPIKDFQFVDLPGSFDGPSDWQIEAGGGFLNGGALVEHSGIWNPGSVALLNGNVIGEGFIRTFVTGPNDGAASIVFRYKDSQNYYRLTVWGVENGSTSGIFKVKNGTVTRLASLPANHDTYSSLAVSLRGDDILGIISGTSVTVTDTDFRDGRVGLMSSGLGGGEFNELYKDD